MVGKDEFEVQVGGVAQRVNGAFGMRNAGVVKNADDVGDRVHFAK
jgi:hypothetical protein